MINIINKNDYLQLVNQMVQSL